jgi:hypothetical protein
MVTFFVPDRLGEGFQAEPWDTDRAAVHCDAWFAGLVARGPLGVEDAALMLPPLARTGPDRARLVCRRGVLCPGALSGHENNALGTIDGSSRSEVRRRPLSALQSPGAPIAMATKWQRAHP